MNKDKKKTCYDCAYRGTIPGNAHTKCTFNWGKSEIESPKGAEHGRRNGWWSFPLNYDPVWMEGECGAFSKDIDREMVREFDPLQNIMSLLG